MILLCSRHGLGCRYYVHPNTTGFCYLAVIPDACSRKVVGYALSDGSTPLALARPSLGSSKQETAARLHSSHGSRLPRLESAQYASETYRKALDEAGLRGSMSAIGNPYHNAQAESFKET